MSWPTRPGPADSSMTLIGSPSYGQNRASFENREPQTGHCRIGSPHHTKRAARIRTIALCSPQMDARDVAILVAEKMGLMATAGLASVLFLPIRNRLLGVQRPRDHLAVFLLGVALSMWGARLGVEWLDVAVDLRLTGVFIAGLLAGPTTGFITAVVAATIYDCRVAPEAAAAAFLGTVFVGTTVGYLSVHRKRAFEGKREIVTAAGLLFLATSFEVIETELFGIGHTHLASLPALAFEVAGNTASVFIFHSVTRVILAREEGAVALVEAKAASQAMSLLALRRRLEPHFLFNALNTV